MMTGSGASNATSSTVTLEQLLISRQIECGIQNEATNWYVLLDPSVHGSWENVTSLLANLIPNAAQVVNLYDDLAGTGLAEGGPRLAALPKDAPALGQPLDQTQVLHRALLILSTGSLADLGNHLRRLRETTLPDNSVALFRFQDTRVIRAMSSMLDQDQIGAVLGPSLCWLCIDECGEPTTVKHKTSAMPRAYGNFRMHQPQLLSVDDWLLPYELLSHTREADSAVLAGLSDCAQVRLARRNVELAKQVGLRRAPDVCLFGVLAFQLPEGFEREPPFKAALEVVKEHGMSFSLALDQADARDWGRWNEWLARQDGMV